MAIILIARPAKDKIQNQTSELDPLWLELNFSRALTVNDVAILCVYHSVSGKCTVSQATLAGFAR